MLTPLSAPLGAKACCAPPLRENPEDRERVWDYTVNGTVTVLSSDHAPTNFYDANGKQLGLAKAPGKPEGDFRFIPNGLPGVETRGPLMWSEGVCKGASYISPACVPGIRWLTRSRSFI